jgi:hypothetical protein
MTEGEHAGGFRADGAAKRFKAVQENPSREALWFYTGIQNTESRIREKGKREEMELMRHAEY